MICAQECSQEELELHSAPFSSESSSRFSLGRFTGTASLALGISCALSSISTNCCSLLCLDVELHLWGEVEMCVRLQTQTFPQRMADGCRCPLSREAVRARFWQLVSLLIWRSVPYHKITKVWHYSATSSVCSGDGKHPGQCPQAFVKLLPAPDHSPAQGNPACDSDRLENKTKK